MSDNPKRLDQEWVFFDTMEAAALAAESAAAETDTPVLPTVVQAVDRTGQPFTFVLTGWGIFRATLMGWPMVALFHRGAWRESFCGDAVFVGR